MSKNEALQPIRWAAARLGIGVSTAYRLAARGELPGAVRVGGSWRISVDRFQEALDARAQS
jgi:excisionase family DNA binding protein